MMRGKEAVGGESAALTAQTEKGHDSKGGEQAKVEGRSHGHGHGHGHESGEGSGQTPSKKRRLLCSLGTGEVVHVMHFRYAARPAAVLRSVCVRTLLRADLLPCVCKDSLARTPYLPIHARAAPGKRQQFEVIVQQIAHGLYHFEAGISDVRVGHPSCDEVLPLLLKQNRTRSREGNGKTGALEQQILKTSDVPVTLTQPALVC